MQHLLAAALAQMCLWQGNKYGTMYTACLQSAAMPAQQLGFSAGCCSHSMAKAVTPATHCKEIPSRADAFLPCLLVLADASVLDTLRSNKFGKVEFEVALDGQDPHVVGVAIMDEDVAIEKNIRSAKRQQGSKSKQQGFKAA